jgi:hypothetical protein
VARFLCFDVLFFFTILLEPPLEQYKNNVPRIVLEDFYHRHFAMATGEVSFIVVSGVSFQSATIIYTAVQLDIYSLDIYGAQYKEQHKNRFNDLTVGYRT